MAGGIFHKLVNDGICIDPSSYLSFVSYETALATDMSFVEPFKDILCAVEHRGQYIDTLLEGKHLFEDCQCWKIGLECHYLLTLAGVFVMFEFDHILDIDVIVGDKLVVHEMLQFLFIDMSVPGGESDSGQTGVDKGVSSPSIDG